MIERKFISRNLKNHIIDQYLEKTLNRVGYSGTKVQRTPLGEKVVIFASKPGLVVGKKGSNIKKLTTTLKNKFGLDNPQIEISEVENINLDANIVAERISNSLERFGSSRFKSIGHRVIEDVMNAGALGIEIIMSGKIPGARAKKWRFYKGYLKKCGDMAVSGIRSATTYANLKSGKVGIKVRIMPKELKEKHDIRLKTIKTKEQKEEKNKKDKKEEESSNKNKKVKKSESKSKKKEEGKESAKKTLKADNKKSEEKKE